MAIQFQCPKCGTTVKTADAAAGKRGSCPQCKQPLLVPLVSAPDVGTAPPASAGVPVPGQAAAPAAAKVSPPAQVARTTPDPFIPDPPRPASKISETPVPVIDPSGPTSVAQALRQKSRKKSSGTSWLAPAVCATIFLGVIGWFYWTSLPQLNGELAGAPVTDFDLPPVALSGTLSGLSEDDLSSVLLHLTDQPAHWDSRLSKMTLTGQKDGLLIELRPGSAALMARINPLREPAFRAAVDAHATALDKARMKDLKSHTVDLFAAWKTQFSGKKTTIDLQAYRDAVGYAALVTGVGYHLEALVEDKVYRCVYEDADGNLYFLLPKSATAFQLRGRAVGGSTSLPANYRVTLGKPEAGAAKKSTKAKTQAEREAENQGMNPDTQQPAANDSKPSEGEMSSGEGDFLTKGLGMPLRDPKNPKPKSMDQGMDGGMMGEGMDDAMLDGNMELAPKSKKPASGEMMDDSLLDGEMMNDGMMEDGMPAKKPATPKKKAATKP